MSWLTLRTFASIAALCAVEFVLCSPNARSESGLYPAESISLESGDEVQPIKDKDCRQEEDCANVDACCGPDDCCDPLWTIRAGAIFLKREQPTARQLFTNYSGTSELMNADGFDFDVQTGVDFNAIRRLGERGGIEVRYFGVDSWSETQSATNPRSLADGGFLLQPAPGGLANLLFGVPIVGTTIDATALSRLHSTEVNLRRDLTGWLTVLGGFRWVELHEELHANPQYSVLSVPLDWDIDTNTDNHMYGFQLGGEGKLFNRGRFSLEGNLKAGIYYNQADVDASITRPVSFLNLASSLEEDHTAFLGELAIVGAVRLTDRLSARAGYQVTWIEGVALATDQMTTLIPSGGTEVNVGGSPLYHGALASLEFVW